MNNKQPVFMYNRIPALVFSLLLFPVTIQAQSLNDKIILTVDGKDISAGEFIRMYSRSSDSSNPADPESYLDQFIIFKLKVADAIRSGYDTSSAFITELRGYRNQLAQNYLTDPDVREKLLKAAYQKSLTEINALHVLVSLSPEASPEDTLKAWKKAKDIRERIVGGESFEQVAKSSSDDPSAKTNGGNLGYFTVFQMITPFEDAAYALKKGAVSEPVRSPFGYHIIKVADKRPSSGKVKTAHIMRTVAPGAGEKADKEAEDTIRSVYRQLMAGASFGDMVKKYSDHRESVSKDGELNWFGAGEIVSEFAEAALALAKNGDISKPVRTLYGWHIIKRIDRKAPGNYAETKEQLESRLNESYLSSISRKSLVEKLKKEYGFRLYPDTYRWFVLNTDTLIIKGESRYDRQNMPKGALYSFNGQQLSAREFAGFIEKRALITGTSDPETYIKRSLETFVSDQILAYENSVLEKKYPDFRYLMNEFYDGILLFEISGRKVWNKAQDDSVGLKDYYELNKHKYLTKETAEGKIYTYRRPGGMKQLLSAWKKASKYPDPEKRLTERLNSNGDSLLIIRRGRWEKGDNSLIDSLEWKAGQQDLVFENMPSIVIIDKLIAPVPLPLSKVKGDMISGYQDWLEKSWIEQLKLKYSVRINSQVLEEIKEKIKNE